MAGDKRGPTALVEDAIDRGVTVIEDIHKSLAHLPLNVLEGSESWSGPAREVRRLHDRTIGAIYGLIRRVNQRVGTLTSELLDGLGQGRSARMEPDGRPDRPSHESTALRTPSGTRHERGSGE